MAMSNERLAEIGTELGDVREYGNTRDKDAFLENEVHELMEEVRRLHRIEERAQKLQRMYKSLADGAEKIFLDKTGQATSLERQFWLAEESKALERVHELGRILD